MVERPMPPGGARRAFRTVLRGPAVGDSFRAWTLRATAWAVGVALVFATVGWVMGVVYGYQLSYLQLVTVIATVLLVPWTLHTMDVSPEPPPLPDPSRLDLADRPFPQADRWERRLSVTADDAERFDRVVRQRIVPVVAERLRQRHGVSLRSEPQWARELLGDPLFAFLTEPLAHPPTPLELERLITRVEEI